MKTKLSLLCGMLMLIVTAGCADGGGATATAGAAVNSVCPVMGGKIDGQTSTEWNGKTIGFCCPPCVDEWNKMSDEERTAALSGESTGDHDHGHEDHDHGDHDHGETEAEAAESEADESDSAEAAESEAEEAASPEAAETTKEEAAE